MSAPQPASEQELLEVLDRGESMSIPERALLLAQAADRAVDPRTLPAGARDGLILALRGRLLGRTLEAGDTCPHCSAASSIVIDGVTLARLGPTVPSMGIEVRAGDYKVWCRPPSSADLVDVANAPDPATARELLLGVTILAAGSDGAPVPPTTLPLGVLQEVGERLSEADPLAEISLRVTCEACEGMWDTVLDPATFVWQELRGWRRRLLWEVHLLAAAYGWTERDILSLPPGRRQIYLGWVLNA